MGANARGRSLEIDRRENGVHQGPETRAAGATLAIGANREGAAMAAGVSARTVSRRCDNDEFMARVARVFSVLDLKRKNHSLVNELTEKNVSVVSILADTASEIIPDANSYRDTVNKKTACFWILDDQISSFTGLLRIPDLPSMVLIDRTGKVLFNGHPSDKRLWVALKKVVPSIERPALTSP